MKTRERRRSLPAPLEGVLGDRVEQSGPWCSVQFSCSVMPNSWRSHGLQHARSLVMGQQKDRILGSHKTFHVNLLTDITAHLCIFNLTGQAELFWIPLKTHVYHSKRDGKAYSATPIQPYNVPEPLQPFSIVRWIERRTGLWTGKPQL